MNGGSEQAAGVADRENEPRPGGELLLGIEARGALRAAAFHVVRDGKRGHSTASVRTTSFTSPSLFEAPPAA